jgi:aminopeptidase N
MADAVRLKDYQPPGFLVDHVHLTFLLDPMRTVVRARLDLRRNPAANGHDSPLLLDEQGLIRAAMLIDGVAVDAGRITETATGIAVSGIPDAFLLETETIIDPSANTELSGLYLSRGSYFTQCEAEGFRRITCFPDRPDVMARFTTTIVADRASCPVLLSNGNPDDRGDLPDGRHFATWNDPHPKPCYLFALVAGDLACVADRFVTRSGRTVALGIHVRDGDQDKCAHAMHALKLSMDWDERVFGLEYDLDVFNIAAVSDFNMGAMENKGLNVFNTRYVLAKPETATDADYKGIETVISHEYFHNWTGNRVTCRDWFQLSLKEGLTVFRDQEFMADHGSRAVKRIGDVRRLRATQFPEDAGPLAHPVQPESYVRIDNFYTATVYQKGAELVRMIRTLISEPAFRAGMDLYFARHDNQAVTIEDFVAAMQDASGVDLTQFRRWYHQAGTPEIVAEDDYDADAATYTLTLRQQAAPALHIPVAMGLIGATGRALPTRLEGENDAQPGTRLLHLTEACQTFRFVDVAEPPTPSLLREFSAPVRLAPLTPARLLHLAANDTDKFVRWESGQQYATQALLGAVAANARTGTVPAADDGLIALMDRILGDALADPGFAAEALQLPGEAFLADQMAEVLVDPINAVREAFRAGLGNTLRGRWRATYDALEDDGPYSPAGAAIGRRALRNTCLAYLCAAGEIERADMQYRAARNMTDALAALACLNMTDTPLRDEAFADFHTRWHHDDLVLDKWFGLLATAPLPDTLARVRGLTAHPDFNWTTPNRVYALIGGFAMANPLRFHAATGEGYAFLAESILHLDSFNTQIAARLVPPLGQWRRHTPDRQAHMREALERILDAPGLSASTREMAAKSRGNEAVLF